MNDLYTPDIFAPSPNTIDMQPRCHCRHGVILDGPSTDLPRLRSYS